MGWEPYAIVAGLGVLGGLIGSMFPLGMAVPVPEPILRKIDQSTGKLIAFHVGRNIVSGGVASLVTWVFYTPMDPLVGRILTEQAMLLSIAAGGAGATIVNSYIGGAAKNQLIDKIADTAEELYRKVGPPPPPPPSGP